MHGWITQIAEWAGQLGLLGVFLLMFVESSLVPFPSEIIMIPAGIAARQGHMDPMLAIIAGTLGSLAGAYFNYFLAIALGRPLIEKYGHWFFLPKAKFEYACEFFERHGSFGTFTCRLIPGIRQLISIPAGLARMSHLKFAGFTALGAGIWVSILTGVGWWFEDRRVAEGIADDPKAILAAGTKFVKGNLVWVLLGLAALTLAYLIWLRLRPAPIEAEPTGTGVDESDSPNEAEAQGAGESGLASD